MSLKQITVTENNNWEGETFNYVLLVTEEQESIIREKANKYGDGTLQVKETNYTEDDIKKMNSASSNSYMKFIDFYKIEKDALEKWSSFGDCFYKGLGLERLTKRN